jgi:N-acetylneuraminate synthase
MRLDYDGVTGGGVDGTAAERSGRGSGRRAVRIGERWVGAACPVFVIAEIGINHNGDLNVAKSLIDVAAAAGCDAVKFQKRTPELCVPRDQWYERRQTPWGEMTYLDYRAKVEFDRDGYEAIDRHCRARGVMWFASCWDEAAVEFIASFDPPCYKAASASLTDLHLLRTMKATDRPLLLSTGMSTMEEIERSVMAAGTEDLLIAHSNSTYPCPVEILNLQVIRSLQTRYPYCPIGYSGHESGYAATLAAVALGACFIERHITLDREMWGSDQRASLEPAALTELVRAIREVEAALGDGVKRRYPSELAAMRKLRRVGAPALIR